MDEKHRHRPTKRLITLNTGRDGGSLAKNRAKKFVVEDAWRMTRMIFTAGKYL